MSTLFTNLTEDFDQHDGNIVGEGTTALFQHYNIREFHGDNVTVPQNMSDFHYWNVPHYNGTQMINLNNPRSIVGLSVAASSMVQLDADTMGQLDAETQRQIELVELASGNEGWPIGDPNVTVGKDSTLKYSNTIRVTLTGGVAKTVTSSFRDNLVSDFPNDGSNYFIELALPNFPAQAAGSHLNLANSFIDFTSDAGYAAGQTDSISFSSSITSLTSGGDTVFRINRNSLVNTNLSNVIGIRFRLLSVGNMTFVAQALRMYKSGSFDFPGTSVDTKRGILTRTIPENGVNPAEVTPAMPFFLFPTRPKNTRSIMKIRTGHLDATNPTTFAIFLRYKDVNNYLTATLSCLSGSTTITMAQIISGTTTTLGTQSFAGLTNETDYTFRMRTSDTTVSSSIWTSSGPFYGTQISGASYTTTLTGRGQVGFKFVPYNYDFAIDWVRPDIFEFGTYQSAPFTSLTPYRGALLSPNASGSIDLTNQTYIASGDAIITADPTFGNPAPSYKITRDGSSFFGGWQTQNYIFVGNPQFAVASGNLFLTDTTHSYRLVLLDKNDSVAWIKELTDLKGNQWNSFDIPLNLTTIVPAAYRFIIQSLGATVDHFWIQNFRLSHPTIAWQATPDNGTTWYNFFNRVDADYQGINFSPVSGSDMRNLSVRAIALSDTAWIAPPYKIKPLYKTSGH